MAFTYSFSNNTSPTGGQLDSNFAAAAALGIFDGTVTGTNALAFSQGTNQPTVSVYTNNQKFAFTAVANSTASVTLQVGSLAALPLYLPTGVQAGNGSIANGSYYIVTYLTALNTGLGGFVIVSAIPASGVAPAQLGSAQGLLVKNNNSVPSTSVDISARVAILQTTGGSPLLVSTPSVTCDLTTTGANGMSSDGTRPTSGWVYLYLISTGSGVASLGCINPPSSALPTFPGGYSYYFYVGAMYCDGSRNLLRTRLTGRRAQYVVTTATNTAALPAMATSAGAVAKWTAIATGAFVPATADRIMIVGASATINVIFAIAPNNQYDITAANPAVIGARLTTADFWALNAEMALESTNIYWTANAATAVVCCLGWSDFYVNA